MGTMNVVPVHLVDVDTFHRMSENFHLLVALQESQGSPRSLTIILWAPGISNH